jgi:serine/threonine protein phosphatase 1
MANRTFAVGDVHGELAHLQALLRILPELDAQDTIVFVGDYVDRGPQSAQVVELVRGLPARTAAKVVALRGNHEDGWLKVLRGGWIEFTLPAGNGCLPTLRSYRGKPAGAGETPLAEEFMALHDGSFFPADVIAWFTSLPVWYEDTHAIYVHAGLPKVGGRWAHPSELSDPKPLLWQRTKEFFSTYKGKRVVFGHTVAPSLPQEQSLYTPVDPTDAYVTESLAGIDTRCGNGGFLTAIELPSLAIWESRQAMQAAP